MEEFDLHNCSLFRGVDEKYIDEFLASCELVELPQGEFLFIKMKLAMQCILWSRVN